jgi:hypothetical protein
VVRRLVAVRVLSHPDIAGLGHLVDDAVVRAPFPPGLRRGEELVEPGGERGTATEQTGETRAVVRHAERVVPAVGLDVVAAPRTRVEPVRRAARFAVLLAADEEAGGAVERVDVVQRTVEEVLGVLVVAQLVREGGDGEVVHAALKCPRQTVLGGGGRVAEEQRAVDALAPHTA